MKMLDDVLIINELVDMEKRKRRECMFLKIDFKKVYDSMSWDYLRNIMKMMRFCVKWSRWIETCVFLRNLSIIVNGSPTQDFQVQKGSQYGDPSYPLFFLIEACGLIGLTTKATQIRGFQAFNINEEFHFEIL